MNVLQSEGIFEMQNEYLTLLPTAFYDFIGYGVGFLSHTPENNVKIIRLT